jgi:hypothetical protein
MILQHLWKQAKATTAMHESINEVAIKHGIAVCHLVENYDCDDRQVQQVTDALEKITKALDVANSLPDGSSRTQHIDHISSLLGKVREQICDMVDCIKAGPIDNEAQEDEETFGDDQFGEEPSMQNDIDTDDNVDDSNRDDQTSQIDDFLSHFLADIEATLSGDDDDFDEDDGYQDDESYDMEPSDDMESSYAMGSERDQDNQLAGDDEQHKPFVTDEDEEMYDRKRRFGNYRMGSTRTTCEGQKISFCKFLVESSKEKKVAPGAAPMIDTSAEYCVLDNNAKGQSKIAGPFKTKMLASNWITKNKMAGMSNIVVDIEQPSDV